MDIKEFSFPKLSNADMAFSVLKTDSSLLEEAKKRGFYRGDTFYNSLFSKLFFSGGELNYKKDIDDKFKKEASTYLRAFMGSFAPKHEEKEAICAMLLSELVKKEKEK